MSKLLISEQPLQVLPSLAKAIGLNDALFLQQLHYWLSRSKNEHDGRVWIYNTYAEWKEQFPFWSLDTMQRIAKRLVDKELIFVHQFTKTDWDRKNWYSINYDKLAEMAVNLESRRLRPSKNADCGLLESRNLRPSYKDQENTQENNGVPFSSPSFLRVLANFEAHRKEIGHTLRPTGRKQLFGKLAEWGEAKAIQALELAIQNGWQGVFEPNGNGHKQLHPNSANSGRLIV